MPPRRDDKLTFKDAALALLISGGMLFWLFALLLCVGLAIGRLEIRPIPDDTPAARARP